MKRALIYGLFIVALMASFCLSIMLGSANVPPMSLLRGLLGQTGYETERIIVLSLRLPRFLAAVVAGVGLSVSGVLLQSIMGNSLASPNVIGVNAGAGLAVVVCLTILPRALRVLPLAAFVGAFITALLILALAKKAGGNRSVVVLAGVACTTLFQAAISFLASLNSDILSQYNDFSIGSFYGVRSERLLFPALLIAVCFIVALCLSSRLTVLSLGDETASALGIRVPLLRAVGLLTASMSAAAVVSYAGLLGFVGLVVPHMARKLNGEAMKSQLATSALLGALLVTLSDLAGRTLFTPAEISVGIVMAFIGAPFFFWLLIKKERRFYA